MKDNKKKILYIILACIILVGAIIIAFKGLNVGLKYSNSKQINIYIGKEFDTKDIKTIVKEVVGNQEIIVQKIEVYNEIAGITVKDITDEQVEELNTKINEKYEIENEIDDVTITDIPRLRLRELVKHYILPVAVTIAITLVYAGIKFRKINVLEILGKIFLLNILAQALYLSLLAIVRIPVNALTVPIAISIFIVVTIVIFNDLETKERISEQTSKKKK